MLASHYWHYELSVSVYVCVCVCVYLRVCAFLHVQVYFWDLMLIQSCHLVSHCVWVACHGRSMPSLEWCNLPFWLTAEETTIWLLFCFGFFSQNAETIQFTCMLTHITWFLMNKSCAKLGWCQNNTLFVSNFQTKSTKVAKIEVHLYVFCISLLRPKKKCRRFSAQHAP